MRHFCRLLCARGGGLAARATAPAVVVDASSDKVAHMYQKCLDPQVPPSELVRFSNDLLPFITSGSLDLQQQVRLLDTLAVRSVRNENVIQKCLWDIFKAPLPTTIDRELLLVELSAHTSRAFRLMAEQQFLNDPQMTTIALGRCIELAGHLTLSGVCDAYKGLRAMNHLFFSTAEAAHHDSELTADMTMKEFYEKEAVPDAETLRNQPNLIDVLCGELEMQLQHCAGLLLEEGCHTNDAAAAAAAAAADDAQLVVLPEAASPPPSAAAASRDEAERFLDVLDSLAVVGVQQSSTLDCLAALLTRYRADAAGGFFIHALHRATQIAERVADPLLYEESVEVRDSRRRLTLLLSEEVRLMPGAVPYLRHHPSELLLLRRLFEREAANATLSPALWDTVRTIRVAHRHTVAESQRSTRPTGKLFDKKYAVKVKPISVDNAEAERFVPPEFKTWRSPAVNSRGGHPRNGRTPRRMAFGTRRISRNYLSNKRKKFCPAVF